MMTERDKAIEAIQDSGSIPPRTPCPFKDQCQLADVCKHQGVNHQVAYSCGAARSFPEIWRN